MVGDLEFTDVLVGIVQKKEVVHEVAPTPCTRQRAEAVFHAHTADFWVMKKDMNNTSTLNSEGGEGE